MKHILAFTVALLVTLAAFLLVTAWSFHPVDLVLVVVFCAEIVVGVCVTLAWTCDANTTRNGSSAIPQRDSAATVRSDGAIV